MVTPTPAQPAPRTTARSRSDCDVADEALAAEMASEAKAIPRDLNAEAGVLGSMIIDPRTIGPMLSLLRVEHFFDEQNQIVFRTLSELAEANIPVDAMILHSTLKNKNRLAMAGGIDYIKELAGAVPTSSHAEVYAILVLEKARRRTLITAATSILNDCYNSTENSDVVYDRAEERMFKAAESDRPNTSVAESLVDVLNSTFEAMDKQSGEQISGLATGFIELDNLTCGLQNGEMIVIAARPSVGKTAFMNNIIEHVGVDLKKPCAIFSLEMSKQQLAQRMLCSRSGVDSHRLRRGVITDDERSRLNFAVSDLGAAQIFIDDNPSHTITSIRRSARQLKAKHGIELIGVDYLQLMASVGKSENRQQDIATMSRGIKALARELNIPVLCLSQLNRSSDTQQRLPRTSDLRESGAIEQDADVVMLLHRDAVMYRGDEEWKNNNPDKINEAVVIVAKQRNGPCDNVKLTYLAAQTRFTNYTPGV